MPRPLPMMIGSPFGLVLRIYPTTMRICFSRPAFARSSAVSFVMAGSAEPAFLDMRAMLRSIRLSRPGQKPTGFGKFRATRTGPLTHKVPTNPDRRIRAQPLPYWG